MVGWILVWADKESIKGEAGGVALGEGIYSAHFFCIENNNSADWAVLNALSLLLLSLSVEHFH